MGRTVATFTQALEQLRTDWAAFRRALRQADRAHFDRLFEHARYQGAAAAQAARPLPLESLLVAALIAHEREVADLRSRLAALEARLAALEPGAPHRPPAPADRKADGDPEGPTGILGAAAPETRPEAGVARAGLAL